MWKYVLKRLLLMLVTFFIICTICFVLIRLLPRELPNDKNLQELIKARWEALGYNKPLPVQFWIYLKNIFTKWDFGTSWYIEKNIPVTEVLGKRLLPTVLVNLYSLIVSIPLGIALGIFAAIKKNKWQDSVISTMVILFVSIPSYVYAFLVQYFLYFKLGWLPLQVYSLADAGGSWFTWKMFHSMLAPVLALSFGQIATLCRYTRAELSEVLTGEFMLLARTKGLTKRQAIYRHAMRNSMVVIFPSILSEFIAVLSGSLIIEKMFAINGVGGLYLNSITFQDYDFFMLLSGFYTLISLTAGIVTDISYGFIDPRIRMGAK